MDRLRRRPEPAAIDITWVSCRGVRSSLPFHTPCLYASIYVTSPSAAKKRPHRVKTSTDRAGGENPEWDAPLRLYVPAAAERESALLVRFEIKAQVAVLGDVLSASAAVPVSDLLADGRTRRVSYQLAASDGRQPNGVISFSYAFHDTSNSGDGDSELLMPPFQAAAGAAGLPSPPSESGMYPTIDWSLTEQVAVYPPVTAGTVTARCSRYDYPPPPSVTAVEPVAVYPPLPKTSARGLYPTVEEPASGLYPSVDLAPMSSYPPTTPCTGGVCGYVAAPEWDGRYLYG